MKKFQSWAAVGLTTAVLALAGCPGEVPEDGGVTDAGGPEQDAGEPEQDAGEPEQDAGEPEQDAGEPEQDAGEPEQDAGDVDGGDVDGGGPIDGGDVDGGGPIDGGDVDGGGPVDGGDVDGGGPVDGGDVDGGGPVDGGDVDGGTITPNPNASAEIAAVLAGTLPTTITGAFVTDTKPAIGNDNAGFFVQAEQDGPALFVEIDPATANVVLGDEVAFEVSATGDIGSQVVATTIGTVTVLSTGNPVDTLAKDLTNVVDLVTNLDGYIAELSTATITIASDVGFAGTGFSAFDVTTAAVQDAGAALKLRFPSDLDISALSLGCNITVGPRGLWRFNSTAQISIFDAADFTINSCILDIIDVRAASDTTVILTANRPIDAATVQANGADFTFDNGLTASAAVVDGATITITTSAQTGEAPYTLSIAGTVLDVDGNAFVTSTAAFTGFVATAELLINEVNANISGGCDLIEFYVTNGGSLAGISVLERDITLIDFPALNVAAGDIIVLHMDANDANCNPGGAVNETEIAGAPNATFAANYDTAFDFYSTDTGITDTNNVITATTAAGIMDVVFFADIDSCNNTANATDTAAALAAAAGQWTTPAGEVPAGGFINQDFCDNAALDSDATGTDALGESIQRASLVDSNTFIDWVQGAQSWGVPNFGQ